jgi:hypothetical protein
MKRFSLRGWAVLLALTGSALTIGLAAALAATGPKFAFSGHAYGTTVIGTTVKSSPSFGASLGAGCSAKAGDSAHNAGLSVNASPALTTGTIDNTVTAQSGANGGSTTATSTVNTASVLGGQVATATTIQAVSKVSYTVGSGFSFQNNSSVLSLNIMGHLVTTPAPNTRVDIPGLGYVIVNEQTRVVKPDFASQTVNMYHLYVSEQNNAFGLSVGTQVIVGHASAGISRSLGEGGPVTGGAYGTSGNVGSTVIAGKTAEVNIPCRGGSKTATVLSTSTPQLGSTGTVFTTGKSTLSASLTTAEATSTVSGVNLFGGRVKADQVKADAHGTYDGVTHNLSSSGSGFTNLRINGQAVPSPQVNTTIQLQNIGTLYLNRVSKGTKSITVKMIELVVTVPNNPLGLKLGSEFRVAVATAGFRD